MSKIVDVLGNNIRNIRKNYGWTQEKLAEKSGISVPFMTQIELGRKTASLEVIEKIAQALDVSYERLFISELTDVAMHYNSKLQIFETELITEISNKIHEKINLLSDY